jgi:Ser/Thr protein kinase RdoA (MazF antagonist)
MEQIRVMRSFVAGDALGEVIADEYECGGVAKCRLFSKLLRTQDNDHYLATAGDGQQYVARIYQLGEHLKRQESDYEYELEWLHFLKGKNLPVSYPIQRRDGRFLGSVNAPEGKRYFALFSYAEGKRMSLKNQEQLYQCGAAMARIHVASNSFESQHARQPMDLQFLVDNSVDRIKRFWGEEQEENLDLILTSATEAKEEILALVRNEDYTEDSWGPIGGDFHSSNTHFDDQDNLTFFNFDLCGPGWRAYDIATFLLNTNLMHTSADYSEAFFAGYFSVRQLSRNEHAAVSPFLTIRRIWLTGSFTFDTGLAGHTFIAPAKAP